MDDTGDVPIPRERVQTLHKMSASGPVVYWMSRDQRVEDNYSLLFAIYLVQQQRRALAVVFTLQEESPEATLRQYDFMLKGLQEVEQQLAAYNIPLYMLSGNPPRQMIQFCREYSAGAVVTDFDPLNIQQEWQRTVRETLNTGFYIVDAHNTVPCFQVSDKQEYAARTFRPKIHRLLNEYLVEYPPMVQQSRIHPFALQENRWDDLYTGLQVNRHVKPVEWLIPGEQSAFRQFRSFVEDRLHVYAQKRNDPNKDAISGLSPYLHFGHISAQRIVLDLLKEVDAGENREAFLEELIVRKELSDNFCYFNPNYARPEGFPEWARKTLYQHRQDERWYIYDWAVFEQAMTHDPLWNAAQTELLRTGKMHGYMRMYWAKKILEWTSSPEEALQIAIGLNDKYELDGRDPNGYAGCMWSIGGVHDRAWTERSVFGKIRYMSYNGCKRKFDINAYMNRYL